MHSSALGGELGENELTNESYSASMEVE